MQRQCLGISSFLSSSAQDSRRSTYGSRCGNETLTAELSLHNGLRWMQTLTLCGPQLYGIHLGAQHPRVGRSQPTSSLLNMLSSSKYYAKTHHRYPQQRKRKPQDGSADAPGSPVERESSQEENICQDRQWQKMTAVSDQPSTLGDFT